MGPAPQGARIAKPPAGYQTHRRWAQANILTIAPVIDIVATLMADCGEVRHLILVITGAQEGALDRFKVVELGVFVLGSELAALEALVEGCSGLVDQPVNAQVRRP